MSGCRKRRKSRTRLARMRALVAVRKRLQSEDLEDSAGSVKGPAPRCSRCDSTSATLAGVAVASNLGEGGDGVGGSTHGVARAP